MTGRLAELARRFQDVIDHLTDKPFTWGQGDGTLSDQEDLQTALDGKADIPEIVTWNPEYVPLNGAFNSITYSIQSGRALVIGDFTYIAGRIRTSEVDVGSASGLLYIPIPFTRLSLADVTVSIGESRGFSGNNPIGAYIRTSNEVSLLSASTHGGDRNSMGVSSLTEHSDGVQNRLTFTIVMIKQ